MVVKIEEARRFDRPFALALLVEEAAGSIVSRTVVKSPAGNVTLFAFAKGEELSTHAAPFDAFVTVLEGSAAITVGGEAHTVRKGEAILMPADIPHSVHAEEAFKMMLVMIKG
jgi:quercetin dioxygenase-like cupin family protein